MFIIIGTSLVPGWQATERADVAYSVAALDFAPAGALGRGLAAFAAGAAGGVVRALPLVAHPLGAAERAMRSIMQAHHVGKVDASRPFFIY
eukprot:6065579-Pyramimonas_sp.AAC.1